MANRYGSSVKSAEFISFYLENGETFYSLYDAYKYKADSKKVRIRYRTPDGEEKDSALKKITIRYRKNPIVVVGQNKSYVLSNVICEYRIVPLTNFAFCIKEPDENGDIHADFSSPDTIRRWISEGRTINAEFYESTDSLTTRCTILDIKEIDFEHMTFENRNGYKVYVV